MTDLGVSSVNRPKDQVPWQILPLQHLIQRTYCHRSFLCLMFYEMKPFLYFVDLFYYVCFTSSQRQRTDSHKDLCDQQRNY